MKLELQADNKTRVVILDGLNTRILTNPPNLEELRNKPNVLINPLFSGVQGVPPHLWVYRGGKLTHDEPVIKNDITVIEAPPLEKEVVVIVKVNKLVTLIAAIVAAALGYICGIS
jgi:hypothetical protein